MKRILRRLLIWVPIGLIGLIILAVLVLGMIPVSADAATSPGPGPKPVDETDNGLSEAWPAMVTRPDNPSSPERAELGRLLFFDPVLSGDNAVSCATCHHPDLGFSDGRSQAMGVDGTGFGPARTGGRLARRHSPTVWNAAFNFRQFWDGRAADLEEQAGVTIQSPDEMNEQPEHLVAELKALPEYPAMFDRAFGGQNGSALTFQNVTYALAAFEQTLLSQNSPFDRYAHGDRTALTAAQRRGLNVFRSAATRCLECHNLTTFADPDFKVTGVADLPGQPPDLGRSEVAGGPGYDHAFKVPTLRNVALHAPYMHNGSLATLEEVIDFYARGGNDAHVSNLDDKIRKFDLSNQEKRDLIAFLNALTDESALPEIPSRVPSGLPVVAHVNNPARTAAQNMNTGASAILMVSGPAHTMARPNSPTAVVCTCDLSLLG